MSLPRSLPPRVHRSDRAAGCSTASCPTRTRGRGARPAASAGAARHRTAAGAKKLFKSYRKGKHVIPVLRGVDFAVRPGEFVAVVGQSGSGKSTLLHLLGTLDRPDAGEIHFEGHRIDNLPAASRDVLRNQYFGMIFQFYHLLPELTTLENVLLPRMIGDGVLRYWLQQAAARRARPAPAGAGRPGARLDPPAQGTVRRRDAAGRHRPGPDRRAPAAAWPTSRPATWTARPARRSWNCCEP